MNEREKEQLGARVMSGMYKLSKFGTGLQKFIFYFSVVGAIISIIISFYIPNFIIIAGILVLGAVFNRFYYGFNVKVRDRLKRVHEAKTKKERAKRMDEYVEGYQPHLKFGVNFAIPFMAIMSLIVILPLIFKADDIYVKIFASFFLVGFWGFMILYKRTYNKHKKRKR